MILVMRKINTFFFLSFYFFFHALSVAQSGFSDQFNDGEFSSNPSWIGQTSNFQVNSNNELQLNDLNASGSSNNSYLVSSSGVINNATWEFYVKLNFNPSTSNFARVYLVSDNQNLTQSLNGYFVQIGGQSGTVDDISLFRQEGTNRDVVELIDGMDGTAATSPELKVRVTKDSTNQWELAVDLSASGNNFQSEGTAIDSTYGTSNFFGVFCQYSSTRFDKFLFDDFVVNGLAFQDTVPPQLNSIEVLNNRSILLSFSELLNPLSVQNTTNYQVDQGINVPSSAAIEANDSSKVRLSFSNGFTNGTLYELRVNNLQDQSGNTIKETRSPFVYFIPVAADEKDIVINELYPDFIPSIGLPEGEFIELFNASTKVFNLLGWQISDGTSTATLTDQIFKPGDYLVLCPQTIAPMFDVYGTTQGLTNFPSLNNAGDNISLLDDQGKQIDLVNYTEEWYNDNNKNSGGYTLELKNPFTDCSGTNNFSASTASIGGTPGGVNSIFDTLPDQTAPSLLRASVVAQDSIFLEFTEKLDSSSVINATYTFSPSLTIASIQYLSSNDQLVVLTLATPLDSGVIYQLDVEGIDDCSGNTIAPTGPISIALPDIASPNDIIINEILFNPLSGGVDFVEIFNRSEKVITLQNWNIANGKNDTIDDQRIVTTIPFLLFPSEYLVLTEDKDVVKNQYPLAKEDRLFNIPDLPSYNDDEGIVFLQNSQGTTIDRVNYSEDQHFALLANKEGVSLERINSERSGLEADNFHSAAESVGFASPGYKNSQFLAETRFSGKITVEPQSFSPDNDGFQDIVSINYQFTSPGFVANIDIFDRNGRLVKSLVKNELLGNKGSFNWDGTTDDNTKARIGIYLILIEAFNSRGDKEVFKEVVVVAGRLD